MSQHTSGPWSLYQQGDEYGCWGKGGTRVFSIRKGVEPMNEDARLIAKAPEMLVLLKTALRGFDSAYMGESQFVPLPDEIEWASEARALVREIEKGA
mgnify:CR=1 FL=1